MKLNKLIDYLFENIDEAALRGFSLDILKKYMQNLKERQGNWMHDAEWVGNKLIDLVLQRYKLPYMGSGSSRAVYALSTGKVLKIAINAAGVAQNEAEMIVSTNPSTKYIGAKLFDVDPDYHWLVMEVAKVYPEGDKKQFEKDIGLPSEYDIQDAIYWLNEVYNNNATPEDIASDDEEFLEFLKDPPKGLLALVDLTSMNSPVERLEVGDIVPHHFGKTADGRVVLIDYGFTTQVYEERYDWGGSPGIFLAGASESDEDIRYFSADSSSPFKSR